MGPGVRCALPGEGSSFLGGHTAPSAPLSQCRGRRPANVHRDLVQPSETNRVRSHRDPPCPSAAGPLHGLVNTAPATDSAPSTHPHILGVNAPRMTPEASPSQGPTAASGPHAPASPPRPGYTSSASGPSTGCVRPTHVRGQTLARELAARTLAPCPTCGSGQPACACPSHCPAAQGPAAPRLPLTPSTCSQVLAEPGRLHRPPMAVLWQPGQPPDPG